MRVRDLHPQQPLFSSQGEISLGLMEYQTMVSSPSSWPPMCRRACGLRCRLLPAILVVESPMSRSIRNSKGDSAGSGKNMKNLAISESCKSPMSFCAPQRQSTRRMSSKNSSKMATHAMPRVSSTQTPWITVNCLTAFFLPTRCDISSHRVVSE